MKRFALLLLLPVSFSGCATRMTLESAKHNPADALLLPITVPVDVIGYPIEEDMLNQLGQNLQ